MSVETFRFMAFVLMSFVAPMADAPDVGPVRSVAPCVAPRQVLRAPSHLERTIEQMWVRSPTFRRQVDRLAADRLLVTIDSCGSECPSTLRAQTLLTFRHGALAGANVRIRFRPHEEPELIAHELEHVIEQLDGVDLPRLASQGNPVVHIDQSGRYETVRADHMGRMAAAEYRAGVEVPFACERTTP
jgi:hypothetical protein